MKNYSSPSFFFSSVIQAFQQKVKNFVPYLIKSNWISLMFSLSLLMGSCMDNPEISDDILDGKIIFDPSVLNPENYLVSVSNPNPTAEQATRPVFIMCHGYSASTFEWQEFVDWSGNTEDYYISRVLLGGHGRTFEEFKSASWKDWQQAIFDEYEALLDAGFTNLHLVGSSTSGALILEAIAAGYFEGKRAPSSILLIDPIVIPSDKMLPLIGVLGPLIGYTEAENTLGEKTYWYNYRPQETLRELQSVVKKVRKDLQNGFDLPSESFMKVYKSTQDSSADPVSAVLIHKGINSKSQLEIKMIDSGLHVFTRLQFREEPISDKDKQLQEQTFMDMVRIAFSRIQ
jgi:carboxylesterase